MIFRSLTHSPLSYPKGPIGLLWGLLMLLLPVAEVQAGNGLPLSADSLHRPTRLLLRNGTATVKLLPEEVLAAPAQPGEALEANAARPAAGPVAGQYRATEAAPSARGKPRQQRVHEGAHSRREKGKFWQTLFFTLTGIAVFGGLVLLQSVLIGLPAVSFGPLVLASLGIILGTVLLGFLFAVLLVHVFGFNDVEDGLGALLAVLLIGPIVVVLTVGAGALLYQYLVFWLVTEPMMLGFGLSMLYWFSLIAPLAGYLLIAANAAE